MPPMTMKHVKDPADEILSVVGDIDDFELFGNRLLVGIYMRPKITASGIHLSDKTIQEDQWQGKACLVLKMGVSAFVSDNNYNFMGQKVVVGDWLCVHPNDGKSLFIRKQPCRLVRDVDVVMKIPAPDLVF